VIVLRTVRAPTFGDAEAEVLANALIWAGERLHAMIGTTRSEPAPDEA
jgi:hypothetical protein